MNRISHSAWQKYLTCPKMYDLHYNRRLRPSGTSSALLFGLAIDEGLNAMLLQKGDPLEVFRANLPRFTNDVSLHSLDIDLNILDEHQRAEVSQMSTHEQAWACLRVKGRILLEAYEEYFMPDVEEVISVQRNLENRPGVIDAIIRHRKHGIVLIDNKTASKPYTKETFLKSTQLALYAGNQKIEKAGFVVLLKSIPKRKTCSSCGADGTGLRYKTCAAVINGTRCGGEWDYGVDKKRAIQVIIGDVPQGNSDLFEASISEVEKGIKENIFPRNLSACNWIYGQPCPYIDYCWKNKKTGLETKESK